MSLAASDLEPVKVAAQIVLTQELIRAAAAGIAFLDAELRPAVARATDTAFLAAITVGATSIPSSGANASGARLDLRALMQAITIGSASKLFIITTPTIAAAWSVLGDSQGGVVFPDARYSGGEIGGIPIISSDGCPAQQIILADANAIFAAQEGAQFSSTTTASVQMDTTPDSPPISSSPFINLWQEDMRADRIERFFNAKTARANGVAVITSANYTGGSPS